MLANLIYGSGPEPTPDPDRPLRRMTFTVAVQYDPSRVTPQDIAMGLAQRLDRAESQDDEFAWRAVRTHPWGTDSLVEWADR